MQQQKQPDDDSKSRRMHRSVRLSTFDWCLLAFLLLAFLNQRPRGLKILDADAIVTSDAPPIPAAHRIYFTVNSIALTTSTAITHREHGRGGSHRAGGGVCAKIESKIRH